MQFSERERYVHEKINAEGPQLNRDLGLHPPLVLLTAADIETDLNEQANVNELGAEFGRLSRNIRDHLIANGCKEKNITLEGDKSIINYVG
jgi:hypothetical protein